MENDTPKQSNNQSSIYPTPASGPFAEHTQPSANQPEPVLAQPAADNNAAWSLALLGLLLLTFFSPLGSALFFPIVVVGLLGAIWHANKSYKQTPNETITTPKSLFFTLIKAILLVGTIIGVGILALIGIFFMLLFSGGSDFRMGS